MFRITKAICACSEDGKIKYEQYLKDTKRKTATIEQALEWLKENNCFGEPSGAALSLLFVLAQYSCRHAISAKRVFKRHTQELTTLANKFPEATREWAYGNGCDLCELIHD